MANLTVVVDDDLLKRSRIRALEEGTSVNALIRQFLQGYTGQESAMSARARALELSDLYTSTSCPQGWTRDELYER